MSASVSDADPPVTVRLLRVRFPLGPSTSKSRKELVPSMVGPVAVDPDPGHHHRQAVHAAIRRRGEKVVAAWSQVDRAAPGPIGRVDGCHQRGLARTGHDHGLLGDHADATGTATINPSTDALVPTATFANVANFMAAPF